ncbi:MAG: zinc ribbon domain-containing protein [Solirubrobacteraceae bacterium]
MPLYDYACEQCGSFEAQRHHTEAGTPAECPECGAPSARQWSVPVVASNGQPTSFNGRKAKMTPPPLQSGSTAFRAPKKDTETAPAEAS